MESYHAYNQHIVCTCSSPEERQLMIPNDNTGTIMCLTCQQLWHMCPAHPKIAVQGPGSVKNRQARTCSCLLFEKTQNNPQTPSQQYSHQQQQNNQQGQVQPSNHPPTFNPNNNPNEFKDFANNQPAQFEATYHNDGQGYRQALSRTLCPHCNSPNFQEVDSRDTTLVCLNCKAYFHPCLVHAIGIKGPGYPKTSLDVNRCCCPHKSLDNNQWKSPFL